VRPYVMFDSQDPERITPFWCELLDLQVSATHHGDGEYFVLRSTSDGFLMGFQRVPEPKVDKNRVHLDVHVDDLDASTAQVESLGGRWIEPGKTRELDGFPWRCMADPEGNEFCIYELPPTAPRSD
jgi:predicted enzyme related to lactoylglutathione lyase